MSWNQISSFFGGFYRVLLLECSGWQHAGVIHGLFLSHASCFISPHDKVHPASPALVILVSTHHTHHRFSSLGLRSCNSVVVLDLHLIQRSQVMQVCLISFWSIRIQIWPMEITRQTYWQQGTPCTPLFIFVSGAVQNFAEVVILHVILHVVSFRGLGFCHPRSDVPQLILFWTRLSPHCRRATEKHGEREGERSREGEKQRTSNDTKSNGISKVFKGCGWMFF